MTNGSQKVVATWLFWNMENPCTEIRKFFTGVRMRKPIHVFYFKNGLNRCRISKGKERKSIYIALFWPKRSGMDHTVLPAKAANNTMPAFPSWAFTRCHHHSNWGSRHPIAPHCSLLIYRPRKDERLRWPSWLTYSGWFTHMVTHQLQVKRRTAKARRPKTNVLPLDRATKKPKSRVALKTEKKQNTFWHP